MAFLILLGNLIALGASATFIWLLVVAFKRSLGWGLAVFFLSPPAAIVFAVKHWNEARKPFLIHTGCLVSIFFIVILVVARGGSEMMEMARELESGEMTQEQASDHMQQKIDDWERAGVLDEGERATADKMRQTLGEMRDAGASPPAQAPLPTSSARSMASLEPRGYTKVTLRNADRLVGSVVRVVEKDGLRYRGTLVETQGDTLFVERQFAGGSVTLELTKAEVESIEIYRR